MKKVFFIVAAAALFFSCAKEQEAVTPDANAVLLKASIENLATKADMDAGYGLVWAENDKIGVGVSGWNDCQPFTLCSPAGSDDGEFVWDYSGSFDYANAYAAFFPWQGQGSSYNSAWEDVVYFKMAGSYGNTSDVDNSPYTSAKMLTPLVASVEHRGDDLISVAFKHAGAAVKVTINNLPAGAHSIGMTADQQLYGNYHINVADAGTSAMVLDGDANAELNTIWLNYDATDAERPFTFIFPTPALTTPKLSFQIWDENGIQVWSKNLKAQTVSPGRGQILEMPATDITPYAQFNVASENWVIQGNMTDNSWASDVAVVSDGTTCIAKGLSFPAYGEFKIKHPGNWDGAWPSSNYAINNAKAGTYDIIFNESGDFEGKVKVVLSKCPYPTAEYAEANHHTSIKNAVDLGATETANCYVITAPGKYKIPCVKGNSSESAGDRASVKLLWETYNNGNEVTANSVIAAVDWDVDDNYVYFKTPSTLKPGNALIAALDANKEIIWSWHIWIPETVIETSTYGKIYNHELMDRNLGALVAATTSSVPVESYGLNYQWGRKDPFLGAKRIDSSSYALISGTAMTVASGNMTVAETIANPTKFAIYSSTDTWGPWLNPAADTPTLWQNSVKTVYDPCPAGYRVPARDDSQPLHSSDLSTVTGWSDSTDGRYFTLGSPAAVFPFCGYINEAGNREYSGKRTFIWTAYANSSNDGYFMNVRTGSDHGRTSTKTSRGGTIRCVKIEEAPEFDPTEKASAVDKSAEASANCYVVTAENSNASKAFKFKTVKGNSNESIASIASASVIWETWNNGSSVTAKSVIDAVEYYDGYVYFRMPATPHAGNALIAVKDSNGTILWSWHIWVPATDVVPIDNGIHTKPMMDRNLGALTVAVASADAKIDVTSMGMWYQWGRKDPFPGPQSIDTEGAYSDFAKVAGTSPSAQKIQISIAESIKNPTLFARGKYEIVNEKETLTNNDWNSTADGTLWGDNTSKSIYDPCPVGYRVPNRDKNTPLWKDDLTTATGWGYNVTNYWFTLGNPASVFPCAGYCDGGSAKVTFRTVLWNAHHDSGGSADTAYNIYVYLSSGNPKSANYGHGKARGYYVRCCAE